ncbi:histone lysine demethylase JmjC NO66 [Toxoplasma gondii ARI]|uniref:Bifunctional lysine-specific demethylase and histidyl-hydroxylase n=1 Tax=Toxoplasma gondii ARI TaxID=1074872 RepID=A0A139XM74_TOXGO|nr:histone lysine demethylase JmjC NO66 [Toxoplasma gondii ARI]
MTNAGKSSSCPPCSGEAKKREDTEEGRAGGRGNSENGDDREEASPSRGSLCESARKVFDEKLFTSSFFREVWERSPLLLRSSELGAHPFSGRKFISEEDMVRMCYRGAIAETLKVFQEGKLYDPPQISFPEEACVDISAIRPPPRAASSSSGERSSDREGKKAETGKMEEGGERHRTTTSASLSRATCLYLEGCSLVINQADRTLEILQSICQHLSKKYFSHVFAVSYLTPPRTHAVKTHTDDQDVFLLQVWGSKAWKIWTPPQILPLTEEMLGKREAFPDDPGKPLLEFVLKEGDILYIPRGFPHAAVTTEEPSLHITLTVPTAEFAYVTCLQRLVKSLVLTHTLPSDTERRCRSALLLKDVPGAAEDLHALRAAVDACAEQVASRLNYDALCNSLSSQLETVNAMQRRQFLRLQAVPVSTPFTEASLVALAAGLTCKCEEGSAEAVFFKGTQSLTMKICPSASKLINVLANRQPATVRDLPCKDPFERFCVLLVLHSKALIDVLSR